MTYCGSVTPFEQIAPAFVEMAHSIVWASAATVDADGRPRSRVLHPIWEFDGPDLFGWIATVPSPVKRAHLAEHPYMSLNYWAPNHDTCSAECLVEWYTDDETCRLVWTNSPTAPRPSVTTRTSSRSGVAARRRRSSLHCVLHRIACA